jgi:hypothetical protein
MPDVIRQLVPGELKINLILTLSILIIYGEMKFNDNQEDDDRNNSSQLLCTSLYMIVASTFLMIICSVLHGQCAKTFRFTTLMEFG